VSDVWQGPGWWLASDGKWYPADAEPGAVYEGDLSNDNSATTEQVVAAKVSGHQAEAATEPARVQTRVGGWQAIEPEATIESAPAPSFEPVQPDDDDVVEEDGWTSAYEERHATSEVLDDAPAAENVPRQAPSVEVSDPQTPDVQSLPLRPTPDVTVADVTVPDLSVPEDSVPDLPVPEDSVPHVPDFSPTDIPDVPMPAAVIVPVSMPEVRIDDVSIPDAFVPDVDVPNVHIPDLAIPDIGTPSTEPSPMVTPVAPELEDELPAVDSFDEGATLVRDLGTPIAREDAWRKPSDNDVAQARADARFARPDVVDLAIPDEPIEPVVETRQRNRRQPGIFVLLLLALVAIGWLLVSLFSNDGPNETDTEEGAAAPPAATSDASGDPTDVPTTTAPPEDGLESVFSLRAGDCIVGEIGAGQVTKVEKVDCVVKHQFEVYREELIDVSITAFDEIAISAYAEEVCRTALANYVPVDDERGLKFKFLQPTEDSWNQEEDPDRVITCLLFDDDAPLIGRAA
jgi:hypothetical protein